MARRRRDGDIKFYLKTSWYIFNTEAAEVSQSGCV
jgi:hypothetical protein